MRRPCWFLCALLTACGPETATTEGSSDAASTGAASTSSGETTTQPTTSAADTSNATTDASTTTGGVCIEFKTEIYDDAPTQPLNTCGLGELCPGDGPLWYTDDGKGWQTDDFMRARCMAAAMRDRTPGQIQYQQPALGHDIYTLEILGEQVIVRNDYVNDFNYAYSERVTFLKPPEFFAECAVGTGNSVHGCLENGFTDECATTLDCPN